MKFKSKSIEIQQLIYRILMMVQIKLRKKDVLSNQNTSVNEYNSSANKQTLKGDTSKASLNDQSQINHTNQEVSISNLMVTTNIL